ncbi:hypothetical protein HAX54_015413 [Datura stramonium]|uniref:Uncharacterized protein n=1 Tax=Datura stramonium TaxID=4076 RepID=A0ABS8TRS0_DATST|nr:hypothetical protein [Datura stramonium]
MDQYFEFNRVLLEKVTRTNYTLNAWGDEEAMGATSTNEDVLANQSMGFHHLHQEAKSLRDEDMGIKGCKTLDTREERVDEGNMKHDCGMMPFEEPLEAVLLNHDSEGIEEFEEVCHTLAV